MPTYYTCSFITTSSAALTTIRNEMKVPTNAKPGIPNRVVTEDPYLGEAGFSKIGSMYLTKTEYKQLLQNPGIKAAEIIPGDEDINFVDPLGKFTTTGSVIYEITGSTQHGEFKFLMHDSATNPQSGFQYYCTQPTSSFLYSGSGGSETISIMYNTDLKSRNFTLDGTGVDVVQTEGSCWLHYDYFDKNGNFRVKLIDWYDEIGESPSTKPDLLYRNVADGGYDHGSMTLSLMAGLVGGLAKNANIYLMPMYMSKMSGQRHYNSYFAFWEGMRILKKWHENKPIDPATGYKRPTIVTNSKLAARRVSSAVYHTPTTEQSRLGRLPTSASFSLNIGENEGVRVEYINTSYVFVSSSTSQLIFPNLGNRQAGAYYKVQTFTGGLDGLVAAMTSSGLVNNSFRYVCATASLSGNTISVTSSFRSFDEEGLIGHNQADPVYIYTGSFNPNNGFLPVTLSGSNAYDTGSLVATLGSQSNFINYVDSIIVDGQEKASNSNNNNYLHAGLFYPQIPQRGPFGATGSNYNFFQHAPSNNHKLSDEHTYYNALADAIYQECAEVGIIFTKPAGNTAYMLSQTGSTGDTFFDEDNYHASLANNYYTKTVDEGSTLAGTPLYYNRPVPANGSGIIVGNMGRTAYDLRMTGSESTAGYPCITYFGACGPGIDVYNPGASNIFACGDYDPKKDLDTHPIYSSINFDTQSVLNEWSSSFPLAWNVTELNDPNWLTFSSAIDFGSSGASAATPAVAGMIACWLQANPDKANTRDVRNWLKTAPELLPLSPQNDLNDLTYLGRVDIDETGSFTSLYSLLSGGRQVGPNGCRRISYLPQSSSKVIEATGPILFENFQFSPVSNKNPIY